MTIDNNMIITDYIMYMFIVVMINKSIGPYINEEQKLNDVFRNLFCFLHT